MYEMSYQEWRAAEARSSHFLDLLLEEREKRAREKTTEQTEQTEQIKKIGQNGQEQSDDPSGYPIMSLVFPILTEVAFSPITEAIQMLAAFK